MWMNQRICRRLGLGLASVTMALLLLCGSQGCAQCGSNLVDGQHTATLVRHVTTVDDGSTIAVTKGTVIEISLRANISTEYAWTTTSVSGASVRQQREFACQKDTTQPTGPIAVCSSRFCAVSPGDTTIKLRYSQPWNETQYPARTFKVTISVLP